MSRSRTAFLSGTITDNPLTNVATTLNSAALASLPEIASPDIAVLVLDPTGSAGAPEVIYVTAHTAAATSATVVRAREGSAARQHASGIAWVHGPTLYDYKGWRLEGSNTSEQTMASTTAADLVTITGLLIPVTQWIRISGNMRKTAGAGFSAALGLKLNSTIIIEGDAPTETGICVCGAQNEAQVATFEVLIPPRSANYLRGIKVHWQWCGTAQYNAGDAGFTLSNSIPNATITDVIIRADSGNAAITVGVKDVLVEVMDS